MVCEKCGKETQEGQKFCTVCGTPVAGSGPTGKADEAVTGRNASATGILAAVEPFGRKVKETVLPKFRTMLPEIRGVLLAIWVILLKILRFVLKRAKIIATLVVIVWIVSLIAGSGMEKQSKKHLKETIQEELLEENEWDKYIAVDKIEDFEIKKDPPNGNKWMGTANVKFKTKRGDRKSTTIGYEFTITETDDGWLLECEADDLIGTRLVDLLESAGYFDD